MRYRVRNLLIAAVFLSLAAAFIAWHGNDGVFGAAACFVVAAIYAGISLRRARQA